MLLPVLSHPVQRTAAGQPLVTSSYGSPGGAPAGAIGRGVEPSGFWDDVQKAVGIGTQIAQTAGPILGALGI